MEEGNAGEVEQYRKRKKERGGIGSFYGPAVTMEGAHKTQKGAIAFL